MSTVEIVFMALAALAPIISVLVAIIVARRNKDKDIQHEAQEYGRMLSDLDYIKKGIDDLKTNQMRHDEKLDDLTERVATVEARLDAHIKDKGMHTRIKKVAAVKNCN